MKKRRRYITICIFLIGAMILFLMNTNLKFKDLYNDILFFKKVNKVDKIEKIEKQEKEEHIQYLFDVTSEKINFQNINLIESVKRETLLNEMLAPGTEGVFDIILTTNFNSKYHVNFQSFSKKPQNLKFENLENNIIVNELEIITIRWYWDYESTYEGNLQDTIDSKNIENYSFNIYAVGEQRG